MGTGRRTAQGEGLTIATDSRCRHCSHSEEAHIAEGWLPGANAYWRRARGRCQAWLWRKGKRCGCLLYARAIPA